MKIGEMKRLISLKLDIHNLIMKSLAEKEAYGSDCKCGIDNIPYEYIEKNGEIFNICLKCGGVII